MSDTLTTLSLITLAQQYAGDTVRQINRRVQLLKFLPIMPGEGKNVAWAPEGDGQLAENFSEGADATNFGGDAQASAILNWGLYRSAIHLSQLSMDAARTSGTPVGNRALWARNVVNAGAKLGSTINAALFNGAGTGTTVAGLDVAIGSTSNTYAGIDRSQSGNAYFRPTVVDPGTDTNVSLALIRDDIRQIYEACGENPDVAFVSPTLFNSVAGLFDATRRYVQTVTTAAGKIELDASYAALEVDGVMFLKDKDATAKTIYYLNTDHVRLEYLPSAAMSGLPQGAMMADDGFGPIPLGFSYEMLAKIGASERAQVTSTIQLVVDRPNACGVRKHAV